MKKLILLLIILITASYGSLVKSNVTCMLIDYGKSVQNNRFYLVEVNDELVDSNLSTSTYGKHLAYTILTGLVFGNNKVETTCNNCFKLDNIFNSKYIDASIIIIPKDVLLFKSSDYVPYLTQLGFIQDENTTDTKQ